MVSYFLRDTELIPTSFILIQELSIEHMLDAGTGLGYRKTVVKKLHERSAMSHLGRRVLLGAMKNKQLY